MRESVIRAFCAGMLAGSGITAAVVFAAPSHADPAAEVATAICSALDRDPTVAEVTHLVTVLVQAGATAWQAGQVIALSVETHCARNLPVLDAFIAYYKPVVTA